MKRKDDIKLDIINWNKQNNKSWTTGGNEHYIHKVASDLYQLRKVIEVFTTVVATGSLETCINKLNEILLENYEEDYDGYRECFEEDGIIINDVNELWDYIHNIFNE